MKEWRKKITILSFTALISSCSTSNIQNEFSKHLEYPTDTKTRATNYLGCFGDMLSTYRTNGNNVAPLKLAVIDVKDATNISSSAYPDSEIPNNFTDMTLGLITRIGGPIRISHIPNSNEILDAARYKNLNNSKNSSYLGGYKASHYNYATIQLYGALTEYDRIIRNRKNSSTGSFEFGSGSGETNLEATSNKVTNVARMTMDFRIANAHIGDIVNNSSSTNTVQVYQKGNDLSFGLSIDGNSIGYSRERSVVDARHKAIRLLIEWGIIEALGRYTYVPYWKCLPNSDNKRQIGFKDIISSNKMYDFHNFNRGNSRVVLRKKSKVSLVDMRDKLLINQVMSDFVNVEYVDDDGVRKLLKRPEKDTTLVQRRVVNGKVVDSKSIIDGKATVRRDILAHYRKDRSYSKLSDSALLKRLHSDFVKARIISSNDNMLSANTYLALWLNVPIEKGARWRK
ncbi:hypothetical protein [uncultured Cocleimonas sp.]|uniref:hypothetical protein n=1 Tax=uncultured Cocleimonas sp. TaxID=1051587 RepID=UPI002638D0A7|nr:hypothetical protein [uncultured Cocleimonas sp.]